MEADLTAPHFTNENKARVFLEALRWPSGPVCPHCGVVNHAYTTKKPGIWRCAEPKCRKDFSVTKGTVYERSHIPLHKWLLATHLLCSSKKGISAHQLWRMLGFGTYRTAWFMAHRIREAMIETDPTPLGGKGKVVEVDETFIGKPEEVFINGRGWVKMRGTTTKRKVVTLVERGGRARSFHVENLQPATIRKVLFENIVLDTCAAFGCFRRCRLRTATQDRAAALAWLIRRKTIFPPMIEPPRSGSRMLCVTCSTRHPSHGRSASGHEGARSLNSRAAQLVLIQFAGKSPCQNRRRDQGGANRAGIALVALVMGEPWFDLVIEVLRVEILPQLDN